MNGESGYTLVELLVALMVLVVGLLGLVIGFDSARRLSLVSERHTTMAHVAQREIEKLEGVAFSGLEMTSTPSHSTDPTNPDYYVSGSNFQWDRTSGSSEPMVVDGKNGAVTPVQSWSEGSGASTLTGSVYEFVTWSTDSVCSTQCPASGQDYKRITVAVTMGGGIQPTPVYVSSVVSDPSSAPQGGVINGQVGNPLKDPATQCLSGSQVVQCVAPIDQGQSNVWFLHDFSSWNTDSPSAPSDDHSTHPTVNAVSGLLCTALSIVPAQTTGCPQPDLMDDNSPSGYSADSQLYRYSHELSGTPGGGRLLQSTSDSSCTSGNSAFSTLVNTNTEFWVTSPLTASMTLTGEGGLSIWSQTAGSLNAVVTLCIAVYDVPPSGGSAGSLANILSWAPTYLGASAYQPPTDPSTGGNWPTGATSTSFVFNYRGSSGSVQVAAGHRLGVRIWANVSGASGIALMYDNPLYPAQLQLNST